MGIGVISAMSAIGSVGLGILLGYVAWIICDVYELN